LVALDCVGDRHSLEHERGGDEAERGEENEQKAAQYDARVIKGFRHCQRTAAYDQIEDVDEADLYFLFSSGIQ
jgi:hypothetical protein